VTPQHMHTYFTVLIDYIGAGSLAALAILRDCARFPWRLAAHSAGFHYLNSSGVTFQGSQNCGPAAMHMVFVSLGLPTSLRDLEQQMLHRVAGGTRMRRMAEVAKENGLVARARRVTAEVLPLIPLPSIAVIGRSHYIVVERYQPGQGLIVVDPQVGRCRVRIDRFLAATNGGEMLLLARSADSVASPAEQMLKEERCRHRF